MKFSGLWRAHHAEDNLRRDFPLIDLDDSKWPEIPVPGHWGLVDGFKDADGPLFYRTQFELEPPKSNQRFWLDLNGIFSQGDVWVDGSFLGVTEGYFFPHSLELTDVLKKQKEHLLAIEVTSPPDEEESEKRSLTGFNNQNFNLGGIWQPVHLRATGPIAFRHLRAVCVDANPTVATLAVRAVVETTHPCLTIFKTKILGIDHRHRQPLAAGENRVEWIIRIPRPALWWPHELGEQPLINAEFTLSTETGEISDRREKQIGFRSVRMKGQHWLINGEKIFLRGANVASLSQDLAGITTESANSCIEQALEANLNLIRVKGHVTHPSFYDAADRAGMLIWQDMPLTGGYHRSVREQGMRQARELVDNFGHHPSIIVWCGHDSPDPVDTTRSAPSLIEQQKPTWARSILDESIRRSLRRQDPSRPAIASSGTLPSLPRPQESNSHLWFGWHQGRAQDLAAYLDQQPWAGKFVSAFGSYSVPEDLKINSEQWPIFDFAKLDVEDENTLDTLLRVFPPEMFSDFENWSATTRSQQAYLLKTQIEILRRRKYRPGGGFTFDSLFDHRHETTSGVIDQRGNFKPAYNAVSAACAQTIIIADPFFDLITSEQIVATNVTAIHDGREPIQQALVTSRLTIGDETHINKWEGNIGADAAKHIGRIEYAVPRDVESVNLILELESEEATAYNQYTYTK
tara:strand:+ start:10 stop:2073 length:2064 start_codon:yes stop_codon:yes gene_type:complete